ncbi:bifunctional 3-demethylubiquinone-9 3-methyltransferase/ 2-octaprenyl-6-hydroxy phenol methylase [Piscirickettsia salmonis]|uniref:methyltransferase domain-containing protein n=1 Tax=Piscirickettsia salmonis TaxID=1238 RepID=UPI001E3BD7D0|nr:methyltransferase domain-containing protein [Piscirickettsia salmonis]QGP52849.1 bifunctional 3-demethylubiquinone-9 3-methyltransferase/ 2-octaprenyl-6-hydroxy phenol methylase [Piscirickettsia salmonis]QGP61229.1 bifunctional 3-demethylubiquinone-9 3-methyltransferase/ 2-octaprenyl-6-hydroxy phenol methylase [Piscirickettsia salmonis]QGP62421.1 bifunctional 3-demethylubiquinone-9 3-methyltransferase/ 2-octaprenyl-6-hydroxy phenol methylase [Piscirickettsia salmonis]
MDVMTKDTIAHMLENASQAFNRKNFIDSKNTLDQLIQQHPQVAEAWYRLALVLYKQNKLTSAIDHLQHALQLDPRNYIYHYQLGLCYKASQKPLDASFSLLQAVSLHPQDQAVLNALIAELNTLKINHPKHTLKMVRKLSQIFKHDTGLQLAKANLLKGLPLIELITEDASLLDDIYQILELRTINARPLAPQVQILALSTNNLNEHVNDLLDHKSIKTLPQEKVQAIICHPLLLRALTSFPISHAHIEQPLVKLRKSFLYHATHKTLNITQEVLTFLNCLCQQTWLNEYIYSTDSDENTWLKQLHKAIHTTELTPIQFIYNTLLWYCYHSVSEDEQTLHKSLQYLNAPLLQPIFNQYRSLQREKSLQKHLNKITSINDKVSKKVRNQYEESPYPRWTAVDIEPIKRNVGTLIQEHLPHFSPPKSLLKPARILIAGCGSGYQAINLASCCDAKEIIAIDLSATSLSYAKRMAEEFNITNIQFQQADILELTNSIDQPFDYILASGVLHHLNDPLTGWQVLTNLLKPKGVMLIGLYSKAGRKAVTQARKYIKEQKLAATPEDIRKLRADILQAPSHPLKSLSKWRDFFTLSECRDLIFHVKEHQFTLNQIKQALDKLSLQFTGFQSHDLALGEHKEKITARENYQNLDLWAEYEKNNPDLFYCMYNFFCQKK